MEKLQRYKTQKSSIPLVFLFQFLLLDLIITSSAYTLPDKYFINCGSDTNIISTRRMFTGDLNSGSFFFTTQSSSIEKSNQNTLTDLYQSARIFRQESFYEFDISNNSTYLVRLHFFAFSSETDLSTAAFNVSASGFVLLHNFIVQKSPVVKEFLLSISAGKFRIYFTPKVSSFAFINAIEVFAAPENFIPDTAPHVSPTGSKSSYNGILSKVLQTIHRINVGGPVLTQDNDTLWRNWVPDDSYLFNADTAENTKFHTEKPNYIGVVSEYFAPDFVYQTAKEMKIDSTRVSNNFNITWSFNLSKNARQFVRAHFCDIVSTSPNVLIFNLFIDGKFGQEIDPYKVINELAAPFYIDFVVDSDDSGIMNISIGPNSQSIQRTAFLNGLEIMELMEMSSLVPTTDQTKKEHILLVVGSVLGGLVFIGILAAVLVWGLKYRKPKPSETSHQDWRPLPVNGGMSSHGGTTNGSRYLNLELKLSFAEIQFATNNFDPKLMIGKGGFGNVYKGILRNNIKVAVKRSQPGSGQGLSEFHTEIKVLSKIRHRHLVSLIGYCDEMSEMILVYEFMDKGTLRDHLYDSSLPCLSWKQRLDICIGSAKGLHYLHKGAAGGIIHRDVKSTNILLDENLVAKVADFGLSRLGPPDQSQTHVSTAVKGTFGYLDPEYFRTQQLTEKSDVYSFGVLLLEVLCAREAINPLLPREQVNLAEWGMLCKNKGSIEEIVDPSLKGQINVNSLRKFVEAAEKCLQEDSVDRPSMGDVLWDLEYVLLHQQSGMGRREPHEDSTNDASSLSPMPHLRHFPSLSKSFNDDTMQFSGEHSVIISESEVFSQLRTDDGR